MRTPSFRNVALAVAVVVALALLTIAVTLVPRPNVALEDVAYDTPGCMPGSTAQTVAVSFTLVNRGAADATVRVNFLVDTAIAAGTVYAVLGNGRVLGRLSANLGNCARHTYGITQSYESYTG